MRKKGSLIFDYTGWWIITLAALVILVFLYFTLSDKTGSLIESFKNFWRFGR